MQPKTPVTTQRNTAPSKKKGSTGTKPPLPPARRKALSKTEHCRAELAAVYREARAGNLDVAKASRLANMLSILSRMIETSDLEARMEALEALLRIKAGGL